MLIINSLIEELELSPYNMHIWRCEEFTKKKHLQISDNENMRALTLLNSTSRGVHNGRNMVLLLLMT